MRRMTPKDRRNLAEIALAQGLHPHQYERELLITAARSLDAGFATAEKESGKKVTLGPPIVAKHLPRHREGLPGRRDEVLASGFSTHRGPAR